MKIFKLENSDTLEYRHYPDGESYIRIKTPVKDEVCVVWCALHHPDAKIPPILFLSETLRDNGAKKVILVAPYLCYMRQDKIFNEGESFTAKHCGKLLSQYFDYIITVDPHLHRIKNLKQVYKIPSTVLHAKEAIQTYIKDSIKDPFLIGPDEESEQWIKTVADFLNCPYAIAKKTRYGDRNVEIEPFNINLHGKQTVVIDDIASSGATLLEIYKKLPADAKPIAILTHAVFSEEIYQKLKTVYAQVITTNTIEHKSNKIDVNPLIMQELKILSSS
ncbi:MAG: ribose-phosphate diphosphokinase [Alphaproteobacteria bacterium]|nr:MAG: ribose-phosphate diphosphokinase [Alphaproteobacteria bacterium]